MAEPLLSPAAPAARTGAAARIRTLVRLRFVVMWNTLRRHPWQLVGAIIGALYGLGVLGLVLFGLVALAIGAADLARTVLILAGAGLILGWALAPILSTGMDRTLDPARLASMPMPPAVQLTGIAVASLLGIPGIVTLLLSAGTAIAWFRSPGAMIAAVVLAPVAAATCVLACQFTVTAFSRAAGHRRFREIIGALVLLLLVLVGPLLSVASQGVAAIADRLPVIADALSWSPLGAVWAVPAEIAAGAFPAAIMKLVIALATPVALCFAWAGLYRANLGSVAGGSRTSARSGLGWLGRFPASPRGAVAARALTYWLRDPRYLQSLIVVLVMPIVFGFMAASTSLPIMLPGSTVLVAALLALSTFTDISYDGTAFSVHVLRGVRGIDDRLGRVWANAIVAVPLIAVVAVVTTALVGRFDQLPTLAGLTAVITLGGFGVASVASAVFVMPVPQAGENPFASKPGAGMLSLVGMAGSYGALTVLALPTIACTIAAGVTGRPLWAWVTLAVGVVTGIAACWGGVRWGAAIFDRKAADLFARVKSQG
ncbi:transporter [Leucobacter manosquensis]|uniref:Transporter n=1 Tax=Leucobacter manosquensis TaxID=2810611 RepID=A0ABS5M2A6_9MICO|nr:transporter [Leucobacter manosquensis]MBS3180841.1 transporter [Leucobacter manosquensis]